MWNDDNDKILEVLDLIDKDIIFPTKCPICEKTNAHLYMYRWKNSEKGTAWVWCSECKATAHERINLPKWWENDIIFDENLLGIHPYMLEESNIFVDAYINILKQGNKLSESEQKELKAKLLNRG